MVDPLSALRNRKQGGRSGRLQRLTPTSEFDPSFLNEFQSFAEYHNVGILVWSRWPGIPYPKWMVLQLDTAEDPRSRILDPERYAEGGPWKDLRGTRWSG